MENDTWKKLTITFIATAMLAICMLICWAIATYHPAYLEAIGILTIAGFCAHVIKRMAEAICDE